jgi:D-3-phosphoglycerate dehydrogenase
LEVNEVNAAMIAAERGIRVSETSTKEGPDVASSLTVRTSSADGTSRSLRGTLIRREGYEPRITGIDEFITEAVPAGPMLITTNRDVPGMIAGISGALAARGVNIAQMNLSRECKGGTALSIINVDEPVDEATLDAIRNIEGILSVKQVILDQ